MITIVCNAKSSFLTRGSVFTLLNDFSVPLSISASVCCYSGDIAFGWWCFNIIFSFKLLLIFRLLHLFSPNLNESIYSYSYKFVCLLPEMFLSAELALTEGGFEPHAQKIIFVNSDPMSFHPPWKYLVHPLSWRQLLWVVQLHPMFFSDQHQWWLRGFGCTADVILDFICLSSVIFREKSTFHNAQICLYFVIWLHWKFF